jgi:hypothetical protein
LLLQAVVVERQEEILTQLETLAELTELVPAVAQVV